MLDSLVSALLQEGLSPEQLVKAEKKLGIDQKTIGYYVNEPDPTPQKKYDTWILKQWMFDNIALPEDGVRVYQVLTHFIEQSRKQNSPIESNIFKYRTIHDLEIALSEVVPGLRVSSQNVDVQGMKGVEILRSSGPYKLLKVSNEDSLKDLGEGTKWCTRGSYQNCYAGDYLRRYGFLLIVLKDGKPFIQYTPDYDQVMDIHDVAMKRIPKVLVDLMSPLDKKPRDCYWYAKNLVEGPWPEGEESIAQNPQLACMYARDVVRGRFPEGEASIATSAVNSYVYARDVVRGRFPEGEPSIATDPLDSFRYAKDVLKRRFPAGEKSISQDAQASFSYARDVIRGLWPPGEEAIASSSAKSWDYAYHVIHGRWPPGEKTLSEDSEGAYYYAKDVLKRPWPEGEAAIAKSAYWSIHYAEKVIRGRFPAGEEVISLDRGDVTEYISRVLHWEVPKEGPPLPERILDLLRREL